MKKQTTTAEQAATIYAKFITEIDAMFLEATVKLIEHAAQTSSKTETKKSDKPLTNAPHVTKMMAINKLNVKVVSDEANKCVEVFCTNADYDLCKKIVGMYANVDFYVVPEKATVSTPVKTAPMKKPAATAVVTAAPKKAARIVPGGVKLATVANIIKLLQNVDMTCDNVELAADEKTVLVVLPANEMVEAMDLISNARYENVEVKSEQTVAKQKAIMATKKVPSKPAPKTQPAPKPTNVKAPVAKVALLKVSKSADWDKIYSLFPEQVTGKRNYKMLCVDLALTATLIGQTKKTEDRLFISDDNAVYFESKAEFLFDFVSQFRSYASANKFVEKILALLNA